MKNILGVVLSAALVQAGASRACAQISFDPNAGDPVAQFRELRTNRGLAPVAVPSAPRAKGKDAPKADAIRFRALIDRIRGAEAVEKTEVEWGKTYLGRVREKISSPEWSAEQKKELRRRNADKPRDQQLTERDLDDVFRETLRAVVDAIQANQNILDAAKTK